MTQSAEAWLNTTTDTWVPSPAQFTGARIHRTEIENKLNASLGIFRMFEIGSLRHGTGIWKHSDADYLVSLKGSRPESQLTTLNKVKAALQARYPNTPIVTRQPAVVCRFSDGDVEVVPGFYSDSGYLIPDPTGGWMKTFPEEHNKYVGEVNKKHNGAAKKLARQIKIWKYRRNVPVSSCYLEMRAAKHLDGESTYLPVMDLHLALKKILDANLAAMNDPTGLGSRFTATSSIGNKVDALSKLETAVARAGKAREYERADNQEKAIEQLKLLFNL
ncbi:SMODS domain-containing nucleotidyltransferase [Arthrobacter sp. NPDC092385]|uniref:SMODS domain-containing nucleotidyltransferase n=1 Tax=Arthrobacter sp. NPDC092385 TaxID=3363943 RepID=UPI0037FB348F